MTVHPSFLQPGLPQVEPIDGKTYRADGWIYLDMPRSVRSFWNEFEAVAASGLVYISKFQFQDDSQAALLMLHPDSAARIVAFIQEWRKTRGAEVTIQ